MYQLKVFGYCLLFLFGLCCYLATGVFMTMGIVWLFGLQPPLDRRMVDLLWLVVVLGPATVYWLGCALQRLLRKYQE
jgi:hypothetical protein